MFSFDNYHLSCVHKIHDTKKFIQHQREQQSKILKTIKNYARIQNDKIYDGFVGNVSMRS